MVRDLGVGLSNVDLTLSRVLETWRLVHALWYWSRHEILHFKKGFWSLSTDACGCNFIEFQVQDSNVKVKLGCSLKLKFKSVSRSGGWFDSYRTHVELKFNLNAKINLWDFILILNLISKFRIQLHFRVDFFQDHPQIQIHIQAHGENQKIKVSVYEQPL